MSYLYGILGIIILALLTYLIVLYVYTTSSINDMLKTPVSLNKQTDVLDSDKTRSKILATGGSSVMGFFNVQMGDRTQRIGQDYQMLFGVKNAMEFTISQSGSQLVITTSGPGSPKETIDLPTIPFQKWTFISILRDGRRFDVLYDDQIVASQRLKYFPRIISNPLIIGNKALLGSAVHIIVADRRLTPSEVSYEKARLADMNNEPPSAKDFKDGITTLPLLGNAPQCPIGLPCKPVTEPPKNTLKAWSTPYS